MDEDAIAKFYFDNSALRKTGDAPLFEPGSDKAIYGLVNGDDRLDLYELPNTPEGNARRKMAASTVILTNRQRLTRNTDGTWNLKLKPFTQNHVLPCPGEKFAHQNTGGFCSGFMVGPDIIVTAGHCGKSQSDILQTAYVFGFHAASQMDKGTAVFAADQVYFGAELLAFDLSTSGDFAVVRVDRKITAPGAAALPIRKSGFAVVGDKLGVIGYPSGLPAKIAFGEDTTLRRKDDPWLIANLDTFGGNSGSAVFNTNGEIEGILVSGAQDYETTAGCFRSIKYTNEEGSEAVTPASAFLDKIPD